MKKIYIAGCGGMLGEAFYQQYRSEYELKCTDKDVNAEWLEFLDFRDYAAYKEQVRAFKPDYLFHLGAYTDLEYCELNIEDTYNTNTLAVQYASYIANELDIPLLYISTAGIFDGRETFYDDWHRPNPIAHYARSKYAGELFVQQSVRRHLICRAGWMMGAGPKKDKKFVQKIMTQIGTGAKQLFVVGDKDGTPTYTHDFARNTKALLEKELWGLYNMVCGGQTNRVEVAQEVLKILGLENSIEVVEVTSEYFKKTYFAARPDCERLINRKLDILKLNLMRHWKVTLREYLENYYSSSFSR
jgi:dTDP-4-dehydrorhamnose reductase